MPHPPDVVAFPESEEDVTAVLDWAARKKAANALLGVLTARASAGAAGAVCAPTLGLLVALGSAGAAALAIALGAGRISHRSGSVSQLTNG